MSECLNKLLDCTFYITVRKRCTFRFKLSLLFRNMKAKAKKAIQQIILKILIVIFKPMNTRGCSDSISIIYSIVFWRRKMLYVMNWAKPFLYKYSLFYLTALQVKRCLINELDLTKLPLILIEYNLTLTHNAVKSCTKSISV